MSFTLTLGWTYNELYLTFLLGLADFTGFHSYTRLYSYWVRPTLRFNSNFTLTGLDLHWVRLTLTLGFTLPLF